MNKPIIAKINDKFETLLLIIQAGALIIITIATAVAIVAEGYDTVSYTHLDVYKRQGTEY